MNKCLIYNSVLIFYSKKKIATSSSYMSNEDWLGMRPSFEICFSRLYMFAQRININMYILLRCVVARGSSICGTILKFAE